MADGVWKGVQSQVIGCSDQHSLNKFLDPSTPSMRKVDDGGKKREKNSNADARANINDMNYAKSQTW